jgi:hypothetical protein
LTAGVLTFAGRGISFVFGAASFYRKNIFERLQARQYELKLTDRKGNVLLSGDDIELCMLAKMMGYRLYRSAQLHFNHHIDCGRLSKAYFEQLFFGFGYCSLLLKSYALCLRPGQVMPALPAVCKRAARKIRLLKFLRPLFLSFGGKAFKIDLLICFEQGLLRFVEEHEDYAETHAAIAAISAQLAAAPEEGYLMLDLVV